MAEDDIDACLLLSFGCRASNVTNVHRHMYVMAEGLFIPLADEAPGSG